MFRTLAAVGASSVVLTASALPAAASPLQTTVITGFSSSAGTVAYNKPVTFTGELTNARTGDSVPGEPVQIMLEPPAGGTPVPVGTGTTGSDGRFTITTTLPSGGYVEATFAGDGDLAQTTAAGPLLHADHVPARLLLDPISTSVPAGTSITFSGTMQVQVDGAWQPFAGSPLTLEMEPGTSTRSPQYYETTSDAEGRFSLAEPVRETGAWTVANLRHAMYYDDWFPGPADGNYGTIDAVSKTRVTAFTLPSRDEAHHAYEKGMYATGTVERWDGDSWVGVTYAWIDFYYRPKGSTTWHRDYGAQTDAYGHFRNIVGVHLGTADWQVRVRASSDVLASTSTGTVRNTITDQTRFRSATIARRSSKSYFNGEVVDWSNTHPSSFSSLSGLKLRLYYRARHSKKWHYYRSEKTGKKGWFQFSAPRSHGYYFKVVFPAQGPYLSCTSHTL